ncbi:LCP family glycopolymer transferase [Cellulomonas sp. P5_C6]
MSPSAAAPSTAPARLFDVLVVGTTNVCRSPAAERLIRARLGQDGDLSVTSAGTHAALGEPVPEPLDELLAAAGAGDGGHEARLLSTDAVEAADLVLTATRSERAAVLRQVPSAMGRTFTLRELARVAESIGPAALPEGGDMATRLSELVRLAPRHRGPTAPAVATDDDILDPAGQGRGAYLRSFDQVQAAVDSIVRTVRPVPGEDDPPPPVRYEPPPEPRHRARKVALVTLASFLVVLLAASAGALLIAGLLDSRVQRFADPFQDLPTRPPSFVPKPPTYGIPVTILVLGSTDDLQTEKTGSWAAAAEQTDVVMLVHISADRDSAQVVAMPPDLGVEVPGKGPGTLRSAFAAGGPPLAVQTIEQLTNVRLDHVALTDSETFSRVTEALGGVDLDLPTNLVINGHVAAQAGERHLTGEEALAWVRGTGGDDLARSQRSAAWLRAILDRSGDSDVRHNPITWVRLLSVVSGSVAVDEGFDRAEMVGLLTSVRTLGPGEVEVVGVPTTTAAAGAPSALVPDATPFGSLMDALRTDTLSEHLAEGAP